MLTDIPTQTRKIFIKAKIGMISRTTKSVSIKSNRACWSYPIVLQIRTHGDLKKNKIRLSFRLESGVSGKKFKRYGHVTIFLCDCKYQAVDHINKELLNCKFGTKLSGTLSINNFLSTPIKRVAEDKKRVRRNSWTSGINSADLDNKINCENNLMTDSSEDTNYSLKEDDFDIESLHIPKEKLN